MRQQTNDDEVIVAPSDGGEKDRRRWAFPDNNMAIVIGPLHSETATGQLGRALIYQPSKGRNVVRAYGKPNWTAHPPTSPQLAVQAMNKLIMEHWPDVSPADQATWDALAIPRNELRCNSYLRENFKRLRSGRLATDFWPAVEVPPFVPDVFIATGTLDPDATGTYTEQEATYAGYPYYVNPSGPHFLFYDITRAAWVIAASLEHPIDNYWRAPDEEGPAAEYIPNGSYTGNAEVEPAP